MILAIDIGNSSTSFGIFEEKKLKKRWVVETKMISGSLDIKEIGDIGSIIIASVVPKVDAIIKKIYPSAKFVKARDIRDLKIKIKNLNEVGADRAVNAYAVRELYGCPAIVVDFGTATTFDVVSAKGEYLGGAIVPGIQMAADALAEKTAKLPRIKVLRPKKIIGDSTVEAMRSGVFYGYIALVEGMIRKLKVEIGKSKVEIRIVATGGYAKFIAKYASGIDIIDQDLTLKGLNIICQKN